MLAVLSNHDEMRKPVYCMQMDIWMDDPESEWEIQESSGGNSENGKLSWMLGLGRKILVTGIVISSAPLVLPPLMAISAIGLFCSIPYGIFLVSYACTETVMSRLLPMSSPAAPLLLEYREAFNGEEEADGDENQGGQNEAIKGDINRAREEEELKVDIIEEVEMRIELVDKEKEEHDKGNILQEGAYQKGGVENDEKKSVEEVNEIVEKNGDGEEGVKVLDEEDERPSQSFEVEVKERTESKVEQPIIEEIRSDQPADEIHGVGALIVGDKKHMSNIEKETPLEAENLKAKEEFVRKKRRKPKKKTKLKIEETAKGEGEQSIKESVNEQPRDDIHGFFTTVEGDEKERDNVNELMTAELKNVAVHVENDELVRESRRSKERNREEGRSRDAAEDKQSVEKAQVDPKVKLLKGNEATPERQQEQALIEESLGVQPVGEVSGVLGSLQESQKKDSSVRETPIKVKNVPVDLAQAIDVEEHEKLLRGASGLSERVREESKTDREVDDKQREEIVNVGGVGKPLKEIEVKIEGTTEVKEEQYLGDESMSEQPIEEVCNIVVEFEGDEKNDSNIEKETPFQTKKVDVQLSQSSDVEENEELARETRGLLEKIRDEGKTDYAVDDKRRTKKEHVGTEKNHKKIVGDVEKAKTRCIFAHDVMGKPTREFEPKAEENKADNSVQMNDSVESAFSKETKLGKDAEGLSEEMDIDNIPRRAESVGPVSETVSDGSNSKELTVESAILVEGEKAEDDNENNLEQNYLLNKEKNDVVFSNEAEDQGLDLLENLSTVSQQGSCSDVNPFEESLPSSSYSVHREISDSSELPLSTKAQESDGIQISAEIAIDTASNEVRPKFTYVAYQCSY
ncbi:hypothetical protein REPUB_Repub16aG0053200 [Reevesia pubescens]